MKRFIVPLVVAAVLAGITVGRWSQSRAPRAPEPGKPAPDFRLLDVSGSLTALSQYRGRVVLVDFWATWCDGCVEELPSLKKVYSRFQGPDFELLAPSLDEGGRKILLPFVAQQKIPWRVLVGDVDSARDYAVYGLPTKYLIDRNGIVAQKWAGTIEADTLAAEIDKLIKQKSR